jgi:hypothetical protein
LACRLDRRHYASSKGGGFFEKHDEDGALMQYHNLKEGVAHRAGFWIFTVVFPAMFALFWLTLILIAYGVIRIG